MFFFVFIKYRFFASHIISKESEINLVQDREELTSVEKIASIEKIEKERSRQTIEKISELFELSR